MVMTRQDAIIDALIAPDFAAHGPMAIRPDPIYRVDAEAVLHRPKPMLRGVRRCN